MKFKIKIKRNKNTLSFKRLLPEILKEMKIENIFSIESLSASWEDIVGKIIASHSRPDRIYKHTLFIAVDHSVFSNDIIMMKDIILKNINKIYLSNSVSNIKVEIKKLRWEKNKKQEGL